jgi:hypothetical protein
MLPAFPEIRAGAAQLPDATAMDGELVVWDAASRLAFEQLQNRLQRRGAGAARAADEWLKLGARVGKQRSRAATLTPDRIEQLSKVGMRQT